MKKLITLLILILFISCSKDDNEKTANFSIVGNWDATKLITKSSFNPEGTDWKSVTTSIKAKFTSGGDYELTMNMIGGGIEFSEGTYTVNGDNTQLTVIIENEDGDNGEPVTYNITELSSEKLKYNFSVSGISDTREYSRSN